MLTLALSPAAAAGQSGAQPDLILVGRDGNTFTGDDIYNDDGSGQTRSVIVDKRTVIVIRIQNDGDAPSDFDVAAHDRGMSGRSTAFRLKLRLSGAGLTAESRAPDGSRGFAIESLGPGAQQDIRLIVTTQPEGRLGAELELFVKAAGTATHDGDTLRITFTKTSTPI